MKNSLELMGQVLMTWIVQVLLIVHVRMRIWMKFALVDNDCMFVRVLMMFVLLRMWTVELESQDVQGLRVFRTCRFILIIIVVILHHFFLIIMISSLPLFLNASRIARSWSHLGCDLLLLTSAKAISTGHHQSLLCGLPQLGLVLPNYQQWKWAQDSIKQ